MAINAEKVWFDGQLVDFEKATVHVLTHTLHYGLGVFEGIRAYERTDGQSHVFRLDEHIDRLYDSCHITGLEMPFSKAEIADACVETLKGNRFRSGYLRPLVFLGSEAMGLGSMDVKVHVTIAAWQWGAYLGDDGLKNGIRCKISSFNRLHVNVNFPKGKICGQYVNSVIAKREVLRAGYDEAIMLDTQGYVSECTGENLFMVRGGRLITAPYGASILGGVTRDTVIAIARDLDVAVEQRSFARDELYVADEIFLCGTAAEITPVREVDDRRIGDGGPGEITRAISRTFFDIVKGTATAHPEWRHRYDLAR
jgi:branched-chain amino acid aminotransferase